MAAVRFNRWPVIVLVAFGLLAVAVAGAQDQAEGDEARAEKPAAQPAASDQKQPIMARVIELHGDVKHAPLDSQEYQPCQLDDEYPERTKIITGVRSSIKLQIGDEEPYSEAYKTKDTKKVRVGVGYGRIRAGVAEGGLKSDFTVDSPVATLSKRGTWGFTLFYERDTDFFEISLTDRGLIEVINRMTRKRRMITPKELITSAMRAWLDQAPFERNVSVPDILGQGDIGVAFNRLQQSGLGVLAPGSGQGILLDLTTDRARASFAGLAQQAEGFFGTGRGDELIEVMIDSNNPLVQKGCARPGAYKFRRSALQGWLREYRGAKP